MLPAEAGIQNDGENICAYAVSGPRSSAISRRPRRGSAVAHATGRRSPAHDSPLPGGGQSCGGVRVVQHALNVADFYAPLNICSASGTVIGDHMLQIFDTLAKEKRPFKPVRRGRVHIYNCGPTVYSYAHIGNLRSFLFADLLRRLLDRQGYQVTQVMNLTDVGHMLADADVGEDKLEYAAHGYCAYFCLSILDKYYKKDLTLEQGIDIIEKCITELRARFIINSPDFVIKVVDKNGTRVVRGLGSTDESKEKGKERA